MADRIHDAFDSIKANEALKDSTKNFLLLEREKRSKKSFYPVVRKWGLAVCAALVVLLGIGYYAVSQTPTSYISIDVNPSVELTLNRWDRVVSATSYNDDGSLILNSVSVKGMKYTDAVDTIVGSDVMKQYLTDTSELTFSVASDNTEKEDKIRQGIENCDGCQNHGGQSYCTDVKLIDEAHENGLSFGKYSAYLILSKYDDTVTVDDCKSMTMAEIRNRIREYEGDVSSLPQGNGAGHGDGNGNGNGSGSGNGGNGGNCEQSATSQNGKHHGKNNKD